MQRFRLLLLCTMCLLPLMSQPVKAAALSDDQKKEVEAIVREMLTQKEPELILQGAQAVQERMEKESLSRSQKAVLKNMDKIQRDPSSPVGANPKGDVTVVEFFDYSCGYCKMAQGHVEKLVGEDKNIRFVYKELPILGEGSVTAAKAALASAKQGKYEEFHRALMTSKERLNEEMIMNVAKELKLDADKLKKDMASEDIAKALKANADLAKELGARGTPVFVIGNKMFPGAVPFEQLKAAVAEARTGDKAKK